MTKALCNECRQRNHRKLSAPLYMATDMNEALFEPGKILRNAEITGRFLQAPVGTERYEGAEISLASMASDYLNGAVIPVDGGTGTLTARRRMSPLKGKQYCA